jgi:hypothetical protein
MRKVEYVPLKNINLRLRRRMQQVATLYKELQELEDMIAAPTPEEFEEMLRGTCPLTLEALMIGVIADASFHLSEAGVIVDRYGPYTPAAFAKAKHPFWRSHLKEVLGFVVRFRAEGPAIPLDRDEDPTEGAEPLSR